MFARLRRARVAAVAVAIVVGCGSLLVTLPASAESSGQADAQVRTILAQVQRIQRAVAAAEKAYDAALQDVGASVTAAVLDGRASDQAATVASDAQSQLDDRVRALYMSGGPLAVYATLLDSSSPTDFMDQAVVVEHVVNADQSVVTSSNDASVAAARTAAAAEVRATHRIATERNVAVVATRVLTLLAQEQTLLSRAQAQLTAIRAAEAALRAQTAAFATITTADIAALRILPASPAYMALYHQAAAAECPGLSWTVLAAIGQVESGHGRDTSTSYAGAMGPMQFMPATFQAYAVDGDHNGTADITDPADAIYTAAHYLCANGAGTGPNALANAIFLYNHADWYVAMVLALAKLYAAAPRSA